MENPTFRRRHALALGAVIAVAGCNGGSGKPGGGAHITAPGATTAPPASQTTTAPPPPPPSMPPVPASGWTAVTAVNAPTARTGHTAVWTGTRMIVWGGTDANGLETNTGGRYDPATDTWTATSTVNAPGVRYGHHAVWTGTRMLVWGGLTGGVSIPATLYDDGGAYDPVADTWTPLTLVSAPGMRYGATDAWSGSEWVVWGGHLSTDLDTGGIYDPVADTWTATSLTGSPSPRQDHAAAFLAGQMVIWGGLQVGTSTPALADGGRLDLATGAWSPTSLVGAPSARFFHSAVSTGKEMIVWGGQIGGATGGRYDPVADTWAQVSTTNAPTSRFKHTALWTGSRMIVFGGFDPTTGAVTNTGGVYDPATDTWSTTPGASAPSPRQVHTAIWTGTKMIVWGGEDTNGTVNGTGAALVP